MSPHDIHQSRNPHGVRPHGTSRAERTVISASEIGGYKYCAKSWHLRRQGHQPVSRKLQEGKEYHTHLGETVRKLNAVEEGALETAGRARKLLAYAAVIMLVSIPLLAVIAVMPAAQPLALIPIAGLALLVYAVLIRIRSTMAVWYVNMRRDKKGIPTFGEIIYTDLDRPAKVLFSREQMLSGKPDYIVEYDENTMIPVEVKSSTASTPYNSHIMQLAAYCILIEEKYEKQVPYGVIVYGDGEQHRIDYTPELKDELLDTIAGMRYDLKLGEVHRNHDSANRCAKCSLAHVCDEAIEADSDS